MILKPLLNRTQKILFNPTSEWENIFSKNLKKQQVIREFALPFMFAASLAKFLGLLIFSKPFLIGKSILVSVVPFVVLFTGTYLTSFLVNRLAASFYSEKNSDQSFSLIIYSSTAIYIAVIIENIFPGFTLIKLFYFYSTYIMWCGMAPMMKTPENQRIAFVIIAALILAGISIVVNGLFSNILG